MKTLIQAVEIWVPDADGYLLEFGGGLYDSAVEFGAISRSMCFGRGEGLPGRVWDQRQPVLLTDLQSGYFRRAAAAKRAGLGCAVALPFFFGDLLKAVVVFYCGSTQANAGAVELWHSSGDELGLLDGYFGATAEAFVSATRNTRLPRGSGLPGTAWQSGRSVFVDGLPGAQRFVRASLAGDAGLERGLAIPCPTPGATDCVLTLLSTAALPIARRLESWVPAPFGQGLQRSYGYCESAGPLPLGETITTSGSGEDSLALAFASAVPCVRPHAADEPGAIGSAAAAAGLGGLIVLPITKDGVVVEAVALYL